MFSPLSFLLAFKPGKGALRTLKVYMIEFINYKWYFLKEVILALVPHSCAFFMQPGACIKYTRSTCALHSAYNPSMVNAGRTELNRFMTEVLKASAF